MNDKLIKQTLLHELAEESIPANYDPWRAMQARIRREGVNKSGQQNSAVKPMAVISMLLVIAFGVFLFASPQGHVLAQSIFRFFQPVQRTEEPLPAAATPLPLVDVPVFEQASNPVQKNPDLEEAQGEVDYPLMQLSLLPQGYHFESAQVDGERVTLAYKNDAEGISLWLEQLPLHGAEPEPMDVGATAVVETVLVGNDQAEYVQGSYFGDQGDWDKNSGASFLRWQHDDMLYTISAVVNPASAAGGALSKESLLALAENLTDDLALPQPVDPDHIENLADAEKLAGFRLLIPEALPPGYQFDFATIEDGAGFVCLQYAYNGASYPSLFIRESAVASLTGLLPDANNTLEVSPVEIAGGEGEAQYVIGFASPENACGQQNDIFRAAQALLWKSGGMSFELYAEFQRPVGGAGLSQAQMIAVAESTMGALSSEQALLDTSSYRNLDEAERAAGYAIQMPAKLPLGSTFDSIHLQGNSSMVLFTNPQFGSPNIRLYQCPAEGGEETPCQVLAEIIPEEFKTNVTMGDVDAVYAKGDWGMAANETEPSWHETDPSQTQRMVWQTDNWVYLLLGTGEGIDRSSLLEIAQTIH